MTERATERTPVVRKNEWVESDFDNTDGTEGFGIQDIDHPGEPNYWSHGVSDPVPGTAKETRDERDGGRAGQHDVAEGSGHRGGHGNR